MLLTILFKNFDWKFDDNDSTKKFGRLVFAQTISIIGESLFNLSLYVNNPVFIKVMTFVMFGCNYAMAVIFFRYLLCVTNNNPQKLKPFIHIIEIVYSVFIILFFINMFTGFIVDFTDSNKAPSMLFEIFRFFPVALVFISSLILLFLGKNVLKFKFTIICYSVFPCVALHFEMMSDYFFMNVGFSVAVIMIYMNIQSDIRKKLYQKENELMQEKVAIMMSQIQPHFLYNSLSAIMSLCDTNPTKVKPYISDFSKYLRGNLESLKLINCITFEKEMEHVNLYLKFEKLRFEDKLKVEYNITTMNFMVPSLSIQPLVENAVTHGICKRDEGGIIKIFTEETKKGYIIKIEDNGVGFDTASLESEEVKKEKVGISNIRNRLASMLYAQMEVESTIGEGTVVTIIIPK